MAGHRPSRHRRGKATTPTPRAITAPPPPARPVSQAHRWIAAAALFVAVPAVALLCFGLAMAAGYAAGLPIPLFGMAGFVLGWWAAVRGAGALGRWHVQRLLRTGTRFPGRVADVTFDEAVSTRGPNRAYVVVWIRFRGPEGPRRLRMRYAWWAYDTDTADRLRTLLYGMQSRRTEVTVARSRHGGYATDLPTDRLSLVYHW